MTIRAFFILIVCLTLLRYLSACAEPLPDRAILVIEQGFILDTSQTYMTVLNADDKSVHVTHNLPRNVISRPNFDPTGRLWLGLGSSPKGLGTSVLVWDTEWKKREIETCEGANVGIAFSIGKAFVGCSERGFYGTVQVLDLETLSPLASIRIDDLRLTTIAGTGNAVLVTGRGSDGDENTNAPASALILIDPHTLAITDQTPVMTSVDIDRISTDSDTFYALNNESYSQRSPRQDVFVVKPIAGALVIELIELPLTAPRQGVISGNNLITLHADPIYPDTKLKLGVVKTDMTTGKSKVWPLPKLRGGEWKDIAVIAGEHYLLFKNRYSNLQSGLYRLDQDTGKLFFAMGVVGTALHYQQR